MLAQLRTHAKEVFQATHHHDLAGAVVWGLKLGVGVDAVLWMIARFA
jgi:hypothetical protein